MSPRVYLDVDGVINVLPWPWPYHNLNDDDGVWGDLRETQLDVPNVGTVHVRWSPSMVAALIDAVGAAEVAWLTSWRQHAPDVLAPTLGLPDWPGLPYPGGPYAHGPGLKTAAVIDDLAERPRPFVWIDDVEVNTAVFNDHQIGRIRDGLADRDVDLPPHMTVAPSTHLGLLPEHIDDIAWFIEQHTA